MYLRIRRAVTAGGDGIADAWMASPVGCNTVLVKATAPDPNATQTLVAVVIQSVPADLAVGHSTATIARDYNTIRNLWRRAWILPLEISHHPPSGNSIPI